MPRWIAAAAVWSLAPAAMAGAPAVEVINLYDAFGKNPKGTTEAFGFSALVRQGETTILFDAGTSSDILERNAKALGIDLSEVDYAVASHAHADHMGGFDALRRAAPEAKIYMPSDFFGAGGPLSFNAAGPDADAAELVPEHQRYYDGRSTQADLTSDGRFYGVSEYVEESRELAPGVHLVATTSSNMGYFTRYPGVDLHGNKAEGEAKFVGLPELSLAIDTPDGQVLLVGCSHSGVEEIVAETRKVTGRDVGLLVGGYHLIPYDRSTLEGIAKRLKKDLAVDQVAPAHCTGHLGFAVLSETFGEDYRFFGLGEKLAP